MIRHTDQTAFANSLPKADEMVSAVGGCVELRHPRAPSLSTSIRVPEWTSPHQLASEIKQWLREWRVAQ